MAPKKKRNAKVQEALEPSPAKSLGEALIYLQHSLQQTVRAYEAKLIGDLQEVAEWQSKLAADSPTREEVRDIGDMLGLIRRMKIKPEKGRRRDLRKVDSVVEDLHFIAQQRRGA